MRYTKSACQAARYERLSGRRQEPSAGVAQKAALREICPGSIQEHKTILRPSALIGSQEAIGVMPSGSARFATAINCMDGRTQIPVIEWMRKRHSVSYVDMITEPGADAVLARNDDAQTIESIKRKVRITIEKHGSGIILVVGHYDCAGNPVDMHTHLAQIRSAVERIASWGFNAQVFGIWIGEYWNVDLEIRLQT